MTDKFIRFLRTFADFNKKELGQISAQFKPRSIKRNTIVLHAGAICKELYFVQEGCLRNYFISKEGSEKTHMVLLDGSMGTAVTSFISQEPSVEFIGTLEDSDVFVITREDFYKLVTEIPHWKYFYQKFLEDVYLYQSRKVEALMTLNARQRFQKLQKGNPVLIQRLSNKVLASFLDMREETLCRIKPK